MSWYTDYYRINIARYLYICALVLFRGFRTSSVPVQSAKTLLPQTGFSSLMQILISFPHRWTASFAAEVLFLKPIPVLVFWTSFSIVSLKGAKFFWISDMVFYFKLGIPLGSRHLASTWIILFYYKVLKFYGFEFPWHSFKISLQSTSVYVFYLLVFEYLWIFFINFFMNLLPCKQHFYEMIKLF